MKKAKATKLVGTGVLLFLLMLVLMFIFARPYIFAAARTKGQTPTRVAQQQVAQQAGPQLHIQQHMVTPTPTPKPTPTPTPAPTVAPAQPTPTQAATTSAGGDPNRYFPVGTPLATIKAESANMTKQQIKTVIEDRVASNWPLIASEFGFTTKEQAYAFFLGMATRESTLTVVLETGSGASHSYGPLQASEDAYSNAGYELETDVPDMTIYEYTPENYYDPGIAVYMGIRHLIHYVIAAKAAGYTGIELLRHGLIGYNTGNVQYSDQSWLQQYSDEIGALAGWYLNKGHLYDDAFTWTTSPDVDRSNYWGWY